MKQRSNVITHQTPWLEAPRCVLRRSTAGARRALPKVELNDDALHRARGEARGERQVERAAVLLDRDVRAHRERDGDLVHAGCGGRRVAVLHQLEAAVWWNEGERLVAGPTLQAVENVLGEVVDESVSDGRTEHMGGTSSR